MTTFTSGDILPYLMGTYDNGTPLHPFCTEFANPENFPQLD
ncbi:hypothetical protein [Nostoc sp. 106C]|nr:hypothetical protein [Nostoc sp. 106C]